MTCLTWYHHPLLSGCGRLTAVSTPITVRASGSRFGSWMTDAMIPSSDSRVSGLRNQQDSCLLLVYFSCFLAVVDIILPELPTTRLHAHTHAHTVFRHIKLVVKATISPLPGMIYITMVTLACSPLELLPNDELKLRSFCITFMASVSQLPLGMLFCVEAFSHLPNGRRIRSLFFYLNPSHPFWTWPLWSFNHKKTLFSHIYILCAYTEFPLCILWSPTKAMVVSPSLNMKYEMGFEIQDLIYSVQ